MYCEFKNCCDLKAVMRGDTLLSIDTIMEINHAVYCILVLICCVSTIVPTAEDGLMSGWPNL